MAWVLPALMRSVCQGLGNIGQNLKSVLMNGPAGTSQAPTEDPAWR